MIAEKPQEAFSEKRAVELQDGYFPQNDRRCPPIVSQLISAPGRRAPFPRPHEPLGNEYTSKRLVTAGDQAQFLAGLGI